jgi:hypothetical protein
MKLHIDKKTKEIIGVTDCTPGLDVEKLLFEDKEAFIRRKIPFSLESLSQEDINNFLIQFETKEEEKQEITIIEIKKVK